MKRIVFLVAALIAAPTSAQSFAGIDLFHLCKSDEAACADFIRGSLKQSGWPEQVAFNAMIKDTKKIEWLKCPQFSPDRTLTQYYLKHWAPRYAQLRSLDGRSAALKAMSQMNPDCAKAVRN